MVSACLIEAAAAENLRGELWIKVDQAQFPRPDDEAGDIEDIDRAARNTLFEDARWIFSAMIYGLQITWTPPAGSRGVQESIDIVPTALIPRGDPNLRVVQVIRDRGLLYILLEYRPIDSQRMRREGALGQRYPAASGSGTAAIDDETPRRTAMERAAVQALRGWLRAREYNRPQEIRAKAVLARFPRIGLSSGRIQADVTVKFDLEPPVHYPAD